MSEPMRQTNVPFEPAMLKVIDELVARQGTTRNRWLQQMAKAALAAEAEGRVPFTDVGAIAPETVPELLARVDRLAINLDGLTGEMGRMLTEAAWRDAAVQKKAAIADTAHVVELTRGEATIAARLKTELAPVIVAIDTARTTMVNPPSLAAIDTSIREVETTVRKRPAKVYNLVLGEDWMVPVWLVALMIAVLIVVGAVAETAIARNTTDGVAASLANAMLDSDAAFHVLAKYRYGTDICKLPPVPVTAAPVPTKRRSHR